jgi:hypothetical protein
MRFSITRSMPLWKWHGVFSPAAARRTRPVQIITRSWSMRMRPPCESRHCPGCDHLQWLDTHHVKHRIGGSETSMANTLLLFGRHHRLLHEGECSIQAKHKHERCFKGTVGKILHWPDLLIFSPSNFPEDPIVSGRDQPWHWLAAGRSAGLGSSGFYRHS